jgi:NPCBM-associated, NEW3 domain of alpha-galactosidase
VPSAGAPVPYGSLTVTAAPALVAPDSTTTVTAALTNNGLLALDHVAFSTTLPDGWTARPATPVTVTGLRSGQIARVTWKVTVPASANPGQAPIMVQAVYTAGRQRDITYSSVSVLRAYATLGGATRPIAPGCRPGRRQPSAPSHLSYAPLDQCNSSSPLSRVASGPQ